jgi:excisionase family DNA binding protein
LPKVNFKSYLNPPTPRERLPSDLEIIVSVYGPYLTLEQAAKCLGQSYQTTYGCVRAGSLKASRNGQRGSYRIPAVEIVKWMEKNKVVAG